jgi:hypothetical protein
MAARSALARMNPRYALGPAAARVADFPECHHGWRRRTDMQREISAAMGGNPVASVAACAARTGRSVWATRAVGAADRRPTLRVD